MKIQGINIRFSVAVLFELAKLKGFKTINEFQDFSKLTPDELLQVIRLCMISGEKEEGRVFDISTDDLAEMITPQDLNDIIVFITTQSQVSEKGTEKGNKKKAKKKRWYQLRS